MESNVRNRLRKLETARDKVVEARKELRKAVEEEYPVGSYLNWKEGPYIKAGIVKSHPISGFGEQIVVTDSISKQKVMVALSSIIRYLEESNA